MEIISFAANNTVLQHFAATLSFFEKETILIQFGMPDYSWKQAFEEIDAELLKLHHLLQITIFCSISQQPEDFCKRNIYESIRNA